MAKLSTAALPQVNPVKCRFHAALSKSDGEKGPVKGACPSAFVRCLTDGKDKGVICDIMLINCERGEKVKFFLAMKRDCRRQKQRAEEAVRRRMDDAKRRRILASASVGGFQGVPVAWKLRELIPNVVPGLSSISYGES